MGESAAFPSVNPQFEEQEPGSAAAGPASSAASHTRSSTRPRVRAAPFVRGLQPGLSGALFAARMDMRDNGRGASGKYAAGRTNARAHGRCSARRILTAHIDRARAHPPGGRDVEHAAKLLKAPEPFPDPGVCGEPDRAVRAETESRARAGRRRARSSSRPMFSPSRSRTARLPILSTPGTSTLRWGPFLERSSTRQPLRQALLRSLSRAYEAGVAALRPHVEVPTGWVGPGQVLLR